MRIDIAGLRLTRSTIHTYREIRSMKVSVVGLCIFAFGLSFAMSASAFDDECRQTCVINYAECMEWIHDPADCGKELRACQRGCANPED